MKNIFIIGGIIIILLVGGSGWSKTLSSKDPDVISKKGIHWHSELEIYVKGEKVEIPQNVGIGAVHQPMHTHDGAGAIHLEFSGVVKNDDTKLGNFFRIWGKDFNEFGKTVTMTVNGEPNTELENYAMKDGDKIVIKFE